LTQEVLSRSMGVPLGDAEFGQIANGTGWGFDALLQAALNAWLARGETEEGFSTLLEESLYRTLLTEARRLDIERHVVAAFATPQLLRKDEFAGVLEFLKDKATSTHVMNAILVGLERARLVERAPHAKHGRVIEVRLTKRGRARVQDAHKTVFGIEERMLSEMTVAQRRRLNETLRRLVENLSTS
jgi:DNA-binding HxlR family transcriptional regulator